MTAVDSVDFASGISAVIAALMNIGPGFGAVGPTHNFSEFSDIAKWFLSFNMLVGRLEMFSALILFYPSFWRE
jgi:trk system potassium uptake protein TrkH